MKLPHNVLLRFRLLARFRSGIPHVRVAVPGLVLGLTVGFWEFAEEDHGSVVLPPARRGVRFALEQP